MNRNRVERNSQAGFTLVEVLIAIVILVFGLVAVTNLFLIAGSSNMAANASSATAALASQQMEELKAMSYFDARLTAGGSVAFPVTPITPANLPGVAGYRRTGIQVPGAAGAIDIVWVITQPQAQLKHIDLIAQARGPMLGSRTQARYTSFRACTDPVPSAAGVCGPGLAPCCPAAP